ncbi:DUF6538 domain-containing protein [Brevundimonas diminuta]|uniref:DUF6538 domain-containing protein n=1 Tax=Brevundimonas diminuta TaxID=293 RepID=UPI00338F2733
MADDAAQSAADSSAYQQVGTRNPVGCATLSKLVENATDLPSARPFSNDVYTTCLHNSPHSQKLTRSNHWANRSNSVYTNRLHIVRTHLVQKRGRIYYRRRVPEALRGIIGRREVWRSLGTDLSPQAERRYG